ncbi:class I SAM-dependent methyltransferase [Polynucleobacter paneuropaeus]|nr:class I SAM-dependent methyltransferase [Polynucleobacter paneuropaeus]
MNSTEYEAANIEEWQNDEYFATRNLNDTLRVAQFKLDKDFINKFASSGVICDVGCSTGEFMKFMKWDGEIYGMEINVKAIEIAKEFINFEKNIFTETDFFDVVVFKGTIQHVDIPFQMIKKAYTSLKSGGHIIFLSTPNRDSLLYKIKKDLPLLDWKLN